MITSVYLSNNQIQVVTGERSREGEKIDKSFTVEIPEGSLLNGMIINEGDFAAQLDELWDHYHLPKEDVELVLNSSAFTSKLINIPKVPHKKIIEMLPMEFTDVERFEHAIYDYMILEENKGAKTLELMAVMVDRKYLQGYIDIFEKINIHIRQINTAYVCAIKRLMKLLHADEKSSIVQIMDGSSMTSILWMNGKYAYTSRQRIFSDRDSEGFGTEVIRNLNQLIQFHSSLKSSYPLETVYQCGFSEEETLACQENAGRFELGLKVEELAYEYSQQLFAAGNLIQLPKDLHFLHLMKKKNETKKKTGSLKYFIPSAAVLGLGLLLTAGIFGVRLVLDSKIKEYNAYLQAPDNIQKQDELLSLQSDNASLQSLISQEEKVKDMLASYPFMNSKVANAITACVLPSMNVEISKYTAEEGAVYLNVTCPDVNSMNLYVDALEATGLFLSTEYQGYNKETKDTQGGTYAVSMTCYLKEESGK